MCLYAQLDSLRQDLEAARAQLMAYEAAGEHLTPSQLEIKTAVRAITTLAKKYEVIRVRTRRPTMCSADTIEGIELTAPTRT